MPKKSETNLSALEARVKALEVQAAIDRKTIAILALRTTDVLGDVAETLQNLFHQDSSITGAVEARLPAAEWEGAFGEWEGMLRSESLAAKRPA